MIPQGKLQSDWKANAFYNGSQIEERGDRKGQPEASDWPQSSGVTGRQDNGEHAVQETHQHLLLCLSAFYRLKYLCQGHSACRLALM